jgi:Uma2 family endonuclease
MEAGVALAQVALFCFVEAPMSVITPPSPTIPVLDAVVPDVPIYRLTVVQYEAMIEAGILTENDPVELLEGWLVEKMSKNPPHIVATGLLLDLLPRLLPAGWFLNVQEPIATVDSLPEPDAGLIRGARRDYLARRPTAADIALLVEVADTSLEQDRGLKKRAYARAGIPVYWIVNLIDRQIEVHTDPTGPADEPDYRQSQQYGPAEEIPVVLNGNEIGRLPVRDLLP